MVRVVLQDGPEQFALRPVVGRRTARVTPGTSICSGGQASGEICGWTVTYVQTTQTYHSLTNGDTLTSLARTAPERRSVVAVAPGG